MILSLFSRLLTVAVVLGITACATPTQQTTGAPEADALLWKISKTGQPDSYLIGTIHLNEINRPLPDDFTWALQQSSRLVVEDELATREFTRSDMQAFIQLTTDQEKRPLLQTIGQARLQQIQAIMKNSHPNIEPLFEPNMPTSPTFAWFMLNYGFTPNQMNYEFGIDELLIKAAKAQNKPMVGLEGMETFGMIKQAISEDVAIRGIDALLAHQDVARNDTKELVDLYNQRQIRTLWDKGYNGWQKSPTIPEQDRELMKQFLNDMMLTQRNHNWMSKLTKMLPEQSHTIAVGMLHLFGDDGLIQLLRKEGYTVTPMMPAKSSPTN